MLFFDLAEEELKYFENMKSHFPDNMIIKKERGFDASTSVQVVIDVTEILKESIPYIVAIVEAILLYRIQKQQNEIKQREYELEKEKLDFEKEKANKASLEIHSSSNGDFQYLIKADDSDNVVEHPDKLPEFLAELQKKLEAMNEKPKNKDKKAKNEQY